MFVFIIVAKVKNKKECKLTYFLRFFSYSVDVMRGDDSNIDKIKNGKMDKLLFYRR